MTTKLYYLLSHTGPVGVKECTNMVNVLLSDVDGTIVVEGGERAPKNLALAKLEELPRVTLDYLVKIGALGQEAANAALQQFIDRGNAAIHDPRYYGRFCGSEAEALAASPEMQRYIRFEAMKDNNPALAKLATSLLIASIGTGEAEVIAYDDAVTAYADLTRGGVRLATFSGPGPEIQRAMLERVPVDIGDPAIPNLAVLVDNPKFGCGMHDKKEFGDKSKSASYEAAGRYFSSLGWVLIGYVTDGVGEALACRETGLDTVFVDRRSADAPTIDRLVTMGVQVVQNLGNVGRYFTCEGI